jgi:putative membrane protein
MSTKETFMSSILTITLWAISVPPFVFIAETFGATPDLQSEKQSILNKVADEVQVEISLGQLAAQRASNEQVKEFGEDMVTDHKKVSQQIELLALKQGVKLSPRNNNEQHQKKLEELSKLSGHAFDREYMDYSIRDHEITVEEFRRRVGIVQDQDIKQWIILVLPIFEDHREKAYRVKNSLQTNP